MVDYLGGIILMNFNFYEHIIRETTLLRYRIIYDRMNIPLISTNKSVLILLETAKKKMKDMSLLRDSYLHCFFGTNVARNTIRIIV